jgi:alpha-tubulin suppressor-like RCC1 family protein
MLGAGIQLGLGNEGLASGPAEGLVDVGARVVQVAAGFRHSCAVLDGGALRCWGENYDAELGYGVGYPGECDDQPCDNLNIGDDETPASAGDVQLGRPVTQAAAGNSYTCVILEGGSLRCWGVLGYSGLSLVYAISNDADETPAQGSDLEVGAEVIQVSLGREFACALLSSGGVRCWGFPGLFGQGNTGQLGYANAEVIGDNETPAAARDIDIGGTVLQIAAGDQHVCALLDVGTVRCWGSGEDGRLGYANENNIGDDESPASAGDVDVGGPVVQIAAGESHSCALLASGGVRCWGDAWDSFRGGGWLGFANLNNIGDDEAPAAAGDVDVF